MPKIGDYVWIFNQNYRVYKKDKNGMSIGSPIWIEHWRKHEIIGETSRSWLIRYSNVKIPKKGGTGIVFDELELDKLTYMHNHSRSISERVLVLDYEKLKLVAGIVGYEHG
jgi:hypothetical protein